jgi:ketosteroid isomerase-like protein
MADDDVMALLRQFGKAFNRGDIDGILACVTDDFEWRLAEGPDAPDGKVVRGKEAVRAALQERDRDIAEMRFSETAVTISGDTVFGSFRATGRTRDGQAIDLRGVLSKNIKF